MFYLISLFSCSPFLPPFLPSPLPHFKMFLNCYWRLFCIPDKIPTKHPGASCGMDVTTVIVAPGTHWQDPGSKQFPNPGNSFLRREFCLKFQKETLILSCSILAFVGFFFSFSSVNCELITPVLQFSLSWGINRAIGYFSGKWDSIMYCLHPAVQYFANQYPNLIWFLIKPSWDTRIIVRDDVVCLLCCILENGTNEEKKKWIVWISLSA